MKDWLGNKKSTFTTLGASSHSSHNRQAQDYYATDPCVIAPLFEREDFLQTIWEPACGEGHLSKAMEEFGKDVYSTDLINRGYGIGNVNFLLENNVWNGDIITNPPYSMAQQFIEHAIRLQKKSEVVELKVAMFLKLTFLEGQKRRKLFNIYPPKTVYVFSARQKCAINGDFNNTGSSAACYAWFVWEKGYKDDPIIKWL
jgi:hypothetical protein